jgi:Uma2 family endonuclease
MSTVQRRAGVRPRRWSKEEYYRLGELGFFHGQRVELIEGRLMVHSPQGPLHALVVERLDRALHVLFGAAYRVRCQLPVNFGARTEPEPDFVILLDTSQPGLPAHPIGADLIIEVADSSLSYDRNRKASLYARVGIRDYWIVNVVDHQLEVYRDPVPDATQHYGHRYSSRTDLVPPATVSPLALPGVTIPVADLLG